MKKLLNRMFLSVKHTALGKAILSIVLGVICVAISALVASYILTLIGVALFLLPIIVLLVFAIIINPIQKMRGKGNV